MEKPLAALVAPAAGLPGDPFRWRESPRGIERVAAVFAVPDGEARPELNPLRRRLCIIRRFRGMDGNKILTSQITILGPVCRLHRR